LQGLICEFYLQLQGGNTVPLDGRIHPGYYGIHHGIGHRGFGHGGGHGH
jgi:hypothetical protein